MCHRPTVISAAFRSSSTRKQRLSAWSVGSGTAGQPINLTRRGYRLARIIGNGCCQSVCLLPRFVRLAGCGNGRGSAGFLPAIRRWRADHRRRLQQAVAGAGPVLALLYQCCRYGRGASGRECGRRQGRAGPVRADGGHWISRCIDPQGAMFALQGKRRHGAKELPDAAN